MVLIKVTTTVGLVPCRRASIPVMLGGQAGRARQALVQALAAGGPGSTRVAISGVTFRAGEVGARARARMGRAVPGAADATRRVVASAQADVVPVPEGLPVAVGLLPGKKVAAAARPEGPMDRAARAETGREDVASAVEAVAPVIVGP